jgi:hypothetical protein
MSLEIKHMERIDKLKLIESLGYKYNLETGNISNRFGKLVSTINDRYKCIRRKYNNTPINIYHHQYAYWIIHREVPEVIDHINMDKLDNRICNLRASTPLENGQNIKLGKGYSYIKGLYQARIRVNQKLISLGYYSTEEEARNAYLQGKKIYHI